MRTCRAMLGRGWVLAVLGVGLLVISGCCSACSTGDQAPGGVSPSEEGCPGQCLVSAQAGSECDDCSACNLAAKEKAGKGCPLCESSKKDALAAAATEPAVETAPAEAVPEASETADDDTGKGGAKVSGPLSFTMKGLDGKTVELSQYKGKVVMIVNVASKCGLTPQYQQLEALYEKYADKGFVIIGVPANNFGGQEPGTDAEIAEFCKKNYGVKFPMLSKVSVKGDDKCDLYKFLTSKETNPKFAGEITWNFEKFIVGRNGQVVARFAPRVKPDAPEVVAVIEAELAKQ